MKYRYFLILLITSFSSNAQLMIGIKTGITIPNLKGSSEQSKGYTSRKDIYAGMVAMYRITRKCSLQGELNFSPQGGKRVGVQPVPPDAIAGTGLPAGTNLYANFKTNTSLDYLEMPILGKLILGNKLKYYVCAGPYISYLVRAKTKTSGKSVLYMDAAGTVPLMINDHALPPVSFSNNTDIKESIRKINGGLQGGLGLQYPVGWGNIFLEGRAVIGLKNIQTNPAVDGKNKAGSFVIAVGYCIRTIY